MKTVSLYVIGTELTRGIISDKHTPFLASHLNSLGYEVKRSVIVPDDGTIEKSLELGSRDSDVILVTGGLGPTSDDITRRIIAQLAGVELEKNQDAWNTLYERVGERIYGANEQQAMIPHGFEVIPNPNGTAPGFRGTFKTQDCRTVAAVAMPGPPAEMQPMFLNYVKPYLSNLIGACKTECDEYSVFLIAEAKLEELCRQCAQDGGFEGVSWGTRFQMFRISLYITGSDEKTRCAFIKKLREITGDGLIADGNAEASELLCDLLCEKKMTVSTAESATAGLLSKMFTDRAGSSQWFWGGIASYSVEAKTRLLGVEEKTVADDGVYSYTCALEMADGIRKISHTDFAVSVTGVAGPDGEADNPAGTVYLGFSSSERPSVAVKLHMNGYSRESSRKRFAVAASVLSRLYLQGKNIVDTVSRWLYI